MLTSISAQWATNLWNNNNNIIPFDRCRVYPLRFLMLHAYISGLVPTGNRFTRTRRACRMGDLFYVWILFSMNIFFCYYFFSLCVWGTSRLPNRMGDHYFFTHVDIINNYYKIIIIKSRFWCRLLLMFRFSSWHDGTKWYNRQQTNLPPCLAHSK